MISTTFRIKEQILTEFMKLSDNIQNYANEVEQEMEKVKMFSDRWEYLNGKRDGVWEAFGMNVDALGAVSKLLDKIPD